MKMLLSSLIAVAMVSGFAQAATPIEKEVSVNVSEVYVPSGFDSDSDVFVVVSGVFPNSCYRWKDAKVASDKQTNVHEVRSTAAVSQGMCLMVLVPFQREVRLGKLGSGEHKVRFVNGDGTYLEKSVIIE